MTTNDANVDAPAETDVYAGTARNTDTDMPWGGSAHCWYGVW